ncbi:hypothetical protein F383_15346 [Gossypium arboreum]|uniref:Uncharacterized protein n=1 Tax=Gossypium arboreum TaxID=29729 RepID=A0A0B0PVP8_GOSAR|nr:hypothetical protein F383_19146 [Gossypium arboreum]KHG12882.1 hypothetical protein F383_19147 [Gossypium arboreum]KHG28887.1 hypothetical protein F383_15346 [Gossypium arboreum]
MEQILATNLISLRSYLHVSAIEQIENGDSYLYVSAIEQILATSLISLSSGADRRRRILSPCISNGADLSH